MAQQANNPAPTTDAGQQQKKMPYGGRHPVVTKEGTPSAPKDSDPEMKQAMQALFQAHHLSPGVGLGTKTWSPRAGIEREQQRRMARGMSAKERMKILTDAGVTDREGMSRVFERAYARPERAFMLVRGRK